MRLLTAIFFLSVLSSCGNAQPVTEATTINPAKLIKDFTAWYNYTYYNVKLSQDFIGLDVDSTSINKTTFLNKLLAGDVVAIRTRMVKDRPVYKLYRFAGINNDIIDTSKQLAYNEKKNYSMEGQPLPAYSFTDIAGKTYNPASTSGKVLVIKCWFIHCVACVEEFPECNKVVEENKASKDVLFVSLAFDTKQQLAEFVKIKPFKYAVVPGMEDYMNNKLAISEYPTHILVNKTGTIVKVVNTIEELEPFLKKEIAK